MQNKSAELMKVAVVGANGFIGLRLIEKLSSSQNAITAIDIKTENLAKLGINSLKIIQGRLHRI